MMNKNISVFQFIILSLQSQRKDLDFNILEEFIEGNFKQVTQKQHFRKWERYEGQMIHCRRRGGISKNKWTAALNRLVMKLMENPLKWGSSSSRDLRSQWSLLDAPRAVRVEDNPPPTLTLSTRTASRSRGTPQSFCPHAGLRLTSSRKQLSDC
ncbi:uncharacterized protein LOC144303751 [Canis aureus]